MSECINSYHKSQHTYTLNLDGCSGIINLVYNNQTNIPVRFNIVYNNNTFTTGFIGDSSFNNELSIRNLTPVSSTNSSGVLSFNKINDESDIATLVIDTPLSHSSVNFSLECPACDGSESSSDSSGSDIISQGKKLRCIVHTRDIKGSLNGSYAKTRDVNQNIIPVESGNVDCCSNSGIWSEFLPLNYGNPDWDVNVGFEQQYQAMKPIETRELLPGWERFDLEGDEVPSQGLPNTRFEYIASDGITRQYIAFTRKDLSDDVAFTVGAGPSSALFSVINAQLQKYRVLVVNSSTNTMDDRTQEAASLLKGFGGDNNHNYAANTPCSNSPTSGGCPGGSIHVICQFFNNDLPFLEQLGGCQMPGLTTTGDCVIQLPNGYNTVQELFLSDPTPGSGYTLPANRSDFIIGNRASTNVTSLVLNGSSGSSIVWKSGYPDAFGTNPWAIWRDYVFNIPCFIDTDSPCTKADPLCNDTYGCIPYTWGAAHKNLPLDIDLETSESGSGDAFYCKWKGKEWYYEWKWVDANESDVCGTNDPFLVALSGNGTLNLNTTYNQYYSGGTNECETEIEFDRGSMKPTYSTPRKFIPLEPML